MLVCYFNLITLYANLDLVEGRHLLFMDERIIYDGIQQILHPKNLHNWIWAVTDGSDQRYGRLLFNLSALVSFLPERFYGVRGQIIATRSLHALILTITYLIFTFEQVKTWLIRIALLILLIGMPYVEYYSTMPKPEPLQILFISLFFLYLNRKKSILGWHWLFLGLAFGMKISTLPIVFTCMLSALLFKNFAFKGEFNKAIFDALINFLFGLAISVPNLSAPIFGIFFITKIFQKVKNRKNIRIVLLPAFITTIGIVIFITRSIIGNWLNFTFFNTEHGADSANINMFSWFHYIIVSWASVPNWLGTILFAILFLLLFAYLATARKWMLKNFKLFILFLILISGILLNLSIIIGVKRLWGFYLYPGSVLICVGLCGLVDVVKNFREEKQRWALLSIFSKVSVGLFVAVAIIYWHSGRWKKWNELAHRTKTVSFIKELASYETVTTFLKKYSADHPSKSINIRWDPKLFVPTNYDHFQISEFWGPYTDWGNSPEILVFGINHTLNAPPIESGTPDYPNYIKERSGYSKYVIEKKDVCNLDKCYRRLIRLPNLGEVLVLSEKSPKPL